MSAIWAAPVPSVRASENMPKPAGARYRASIDVVAIPTATPSRRSRRDAAVAMLSPRAVRAVVAAAVIGPPAAPGSRPPPAGLRHLVLVQEQLRRGRVVEGRRTGPRSGQDGVPDGFRSMVCGD